MTIETHVCSLELSKRLKELAIPQNSFIKWWISDRSGYAFLVPPNQFVDSTDTYINKYSAFLASELGEMLPSALKAQTGSQLDRPIIMQKTYDGVYYIYGQCENGSTYPMMNDNTEANARAKMLIYLIENDSIKVEELK